MLKIFIIEVVRSLSLLSYSSRSRSLWSCKSRGCVHSSSRCSNHRALAHHKPKRPFFLFVPSASFPSSTNLSFFSFPGLCFLRFSFFRGVGGLLGVGRLRPQPWLLASAAVPKIIDATHPIPVHRLWRRFIRKKTALSSLRRTQHGHNRTALFLLFFLSAKKKLLYHCFHSDKERKTKNYAKSFQKLNRPMLHFFCATSS